MINRRALVLATVAGTIAQVAMVVVGHSSDSVKNLFAVGGMGLSLLAGILYVILAPRGEDASPTIGGATAGALCAFIGIAVSFLLGDVPASLMAVGTTGSLVMGALGGFVTGKVVSGRPASAALRG